MKWACVMVMLALAAGPVAAQASPEASSSPAAAPSSSYIPVHKFDPKRDPGADLQAAMPEAQRTGKRILLDVGGDWCVYCHQMNLLFEQHPDLARLRDDNFVTVAVYYGDDNKNTQFLSHYEKVQSVPYVFVLDDHGGVLHAQGLIDLRSSEGYSPEKMKQFLLRWSAAASGPPSPHP